jgi:hypothetical protein
MKRRYNYHLIIDKDKQKSRTALPVKKMQFISALKDGGFFLSSANKIYFISIIILTLLMGSFTTFAIFSYNNSVNANNSIKFLSEKCVEKRETKNFKIIENALSFKKKGKTLNFLDESATPLYYKKTDKIKKQLGFTDSLYKIRKRSYSAFYKIREWSGRHTITRDEYYALATFLTIKGAYFDDNVNIITNAINKLQDFN